MVRNQTVQESAQARLKLNIEGATFVLSVVLPSNKHEVSTGGATDRFYGPCQVHHEKKFRHYCGKRAQPNCPLLDDVRVRCPGRREVCKVDASVRCGTFSPTEAT